MMCLCTCEINLAPTLFYCLNPRPYELRSAAYSYLYDLMAVMILGAISCIVGID
jgi:hypothetical protein